MSLETPDAAPYPDAPDANPNDAPPRQPRRWIWSALAIVVVLILGLTPPLLNVNRLRRRIAASISASIGRPVHLDSVELHLLPVPAFTLTNLVVSEDPAFGYEPVIRAMTVEATLRPSSLWRRQVEFSTIRFVNPSLNLVRNAQGRWNLQSLLMHASHVDTAPTAQRHHGPEPRFPYIEATNARVNLKLGQEKQPFSLTAADFALWLPSPEQWRVRIDGTPARTDTNIGDPGTVRLEGSLSRAATMAAVPVNFTASWRDAPLGEASKLLTGQDAGWRGTLNLDAALSGTLGAGHLITSVHINDLRRADFIPTQSLDLNLDCNGKLATTTAIIDAPQCVLRSPHISAIADSLNLAALRTSGLGASGIRVGSPGVSERWVLDWVRLFSQRYPASESGVGKISGSLAFVPATDTTPWFWQGTLHGNTKPLLQPSSTHESGLPPEAPRQFSIVSGADGAVLAPLDLMPADKTPPLLFSADIGRAGYELNLRGTATAQQIRSLRAIAPPLTDGLDQALGLDRPPNATTVPSPTPDQNSTTTTAAKPMKIDVTCTRPWGEAQTCAPVTPTPAIKPHRRHRR